MPCARGLDEAQRHASRVQEENSSGLDADQLERVTQVDALQHRVDVSIVQQSQQPMNGDGDVARLSRLYVLTEHTTGSLNGVDNDLVIGARE